MREKSIRLVVTLVAFAYAIFSAAQAAVFYLGWANPGIDVLQDLIGPRSVIALCIAIAALTGWLLGRSGKIVSCVFAAFALAQFYLWWVSTQDIKVNSGLELIPGTWLTNWWAGAGYFDAVAFLAATYFLLSGFYSIFAGRKSPEGRMRALDTAEQLDQKMSRTRVPTPTQ